MLEVESAAMNSNAELRYVYLEVRAQWNGSVETLEDALHIRVESVTPLCFERQAQSTLPRPQ